MAENIKGTNISSPIAPFTSDDAYPTHLAEYGKGGYRSVNTIADLDKIPAARREEGMLVYVIDDESGTHTYQYINGTWARNKLVPGAGIPIYDQNKIDKLGDDAEPDYVHIPNKDTDLDGEITNNTYTTTENGTYVDILFKALRELQSEVARLRNAFDYGIHSYTGKDTAMSRVEGEYEGDVESEPLWSIEENSLSEIEAASLILDETNVNKMQPVENIDTTTDGVFVINEEGASWLDSNCENAVAEVEDPKLFLYLTTNSNTVTIKMKDMDGGNETLEIDLSQLRISSLDIYNYLIVLSRKQEIEDDRNGSISYKGKNYVWISIGNPKTDSTIVEGYYNNGDIVSDLEELDNRFTFSEVEFRDLRLSKCRFYSKYQDFSKEVIPSKPTDDNYTYKAAHITIRSVDKFETLESIQNQLPENELIYVENSRKLYIKNNYKLIAISGSTNPEDTGMNENEVLNLLKGLGIVKDENTDELSIADLSDITFIHGDTGKKFKFEVDAYGDLKSTEIGGKTLAERITSSRVELTDRTWRGLVGQLRLQEQIKGVEGTDAMPLSSTKDIGLYSDRVKIGAFYAPARSNTTFGCSHGYIELENTSDADFQLDGCYMHYVRKPVGEDEYRVSHLPLKGTIPAGGTFLIRGKQYANLDDPNVFIKVGTYDMEWYEDRELIDFSHNGKVVDNSGNDPHGFCLTYGEKNLGYDTQVWSTNGGNYSDKAPHLYRSFYIDSVYYNSPITSSSDAPYWTTNKISMSKIKDNVFVDAIYKNTFELDPAKQAYQSLNTFDSSRIRHASTNDYQYVRLDNEVISFPKTAETYPVSKFTPKASFEKKNVLTDKNKLDPNKPNMVTCSFGINPYTTRTFNWVSAGLFDEYVWIKNKNGEDGWTKFSSYTEVTTTANTEGTSYPRRKEFSKDVNNIIYARKYGHFPGDEASSYTAHKCILVLRPDAPDSPETYTYVVGRANNDGKAPDTNHCSTEMKFTLYPTSYTPRIYQVTDQQGFHWIEYQSWGAAAQKVNDRINAEAANSDIIPVLMNTGDMTQSGARVNEWVDYYNAGFNLFNHLEQVNVVGNNDLCGTDFKILGTGDDIGKSNSYYFHVFYCYEVDTTVGSIPIINGKYVPSLYYIDFANYRLIMVNSEITYENCKSWFEVTGDNGEVVNVYTGWTVPMKEGNIPTFYNNSDFTSIYTMLYNMTATSKEKIVACHEMPFTVITQENLKNNPTMLQKSRSLSGTSLVGSHLNQLNANDEVGIYWFSRLLEFRRIRLCLGGHKHTYSCTYPVMENYLYKDSADSEYKSSLNNGPMRMVETLVNDNLVSWTGNVVVDAENTFTNAHLSKFPLTKRPNDPGYGGSTFYPIKYVNNFADDREGVIYLMCQATGFKLMSNKELPSPAQAFSRLLPKSTYNDTTGAAKASEEQRYPMYVIVDLGNTTITAKLIRLTNIQAAPTKLFSQYEYGTKPTGEQYLYENYDWTPGEENPWKNIDPGDVISTVGTNETWKYGSWTTTEREIISINK